MQPTRSTPDALRTALPPDVGNIHSQPQLSHWLRVLWDVAPPMHFDTETPYITSGTVHLPPRQHWLQHCAAATHAVAHLVYSPARFDATGLAPIARALMALLEDARVETLACRELPGLARLWRPLHTATPEDGGHFEALLRRLARALADPDYEDDHPWVAKGRKLFFLDAELGMPALRTPAELRAAALRLGNDIGQMRLQFNARGYRPEPSFRDDHRWMWGADDLQEVEPPPIDPLGSGDEPDEPETDEGAAIFHHPEWDRLIGRLRPEWTRVLEQPLTAPSLVDSSPSQARAEDSAHELGRRLLGPLSGLARQRAMRRRSSEGDTFDPAALVDWRIARRMRGTADARVYRGPHRQSVPTAVWLLVDQSASTSASLERGVGTILQAAVASAAAISAALRSRGITCVVAGFNSNGRNEVRVRTAYAGNGSMLTRLKALKSAGSTRLGAAIRHATARLSTSHATARWVIVLSDGEPHDIDIHDPRYLVEDARHAVREAARRSVRVACVTLATGDTASTRTEVRRIFGARGTQTISDLKLLPRVVQQLLG
ncbi:hypothetical protein BH09PSE5_BH09PSE5_01870 [soil metagenome]